ncbi:hypothetical protein GUJ93_ZPchr0458g22311 [Zizania palustris]|uniref:Uncharacterized protein n=1 Tax=Zizania palustris TaxID=103762 RepID=A0A8J5RCZ5_ZIZPA|nr:hypothetical protein GUJ93_ZPchr0458g22311 [Zizania palustris]
MATPSGILEVRCAGCGETLEVERGLTEFACPDCGTPQALPPELMPPRPRRAIPLPGRGAPSAVSAAPSRVPCGGCGAILSVPHGPGHFACPICRTEIAPSLAAVVSVVAPPAAIPIMSSQPEKPSEMLNGSSIQPTLAGQVHKSIISEHTHGQHHKHSFREESFSSFRVDARRQIPEVERLQNEPVNPSADREESHTEPLDVTIARPGKKKSIPAASPKSYREGKAQEEHTNQVIHASRGQGMPTNSEGGFSDDMITMHNKQKTGQMVVPSVIELEQINPLHKVCDEQQAGEIFSDGVHGEQVQVDFACKAIQSKKERTKYMKGNQKTRGKGAMDYLTELPCRRRSKRLAKGPPDIIDITPIHKVDPSPKQNLSEAPQIERTIADTDHISPTQHQCPQSVSNTLDNIDVTTPSAFLNHNMPQVERNPQYYSQMYSPENRWAQANPSSNSCYEHEIPKQCFDGIVQLDSSNEEVHSNLLEDQNQDMDGQLSQEACVGNNHLEPAQFKSHTKNLAGYGRQNKNGFICSSDNAKHHGDLSSGIGTWHQINLAASCSRPALPVLAATPLPTISSPSSFEKLSLNQSSPTPTTPHYQSLPLYSQDAHNGDMLSASVRKTSKKRRGRAPAVLMEPREEADRPVLTPNGTE